MNFSLSARNFHPVISVFDITHRAIHAPDDMCSCADDTELNYLTEKPVPLDSDRMLRDKHEL